MRHNFNDELRMMSAKVVNNFQIKKSPLIDFSFSEDFHFYSGAE